MIPELEIHQTKEKDIELVQQNIKGFVHPLEENPILSGRYIEDVVLAHGATTSIEHKLDRQPRGWILCDIMGDMIESYGRTAWDETTITFDVTTTGTNDITVRLWVF